MSAPVSLLSRDHPLIREAMVAKMMKDLVQIHQTFLDKVEEISAHAKTIHNLPKGEKGDTPSIDYPGIIREVVKAIPVPENGKDVDENALVEKVYGMIKKPKDGRTPIIDEERIAVRAAKLVPKPIVQEMDHEALADLVVEKIAKGKKFKIEHVSGLKEEVASYRNQLAGKVYGKDTWARGGGDTVIAGTGITITSTVNGQKQISAPGSPGTAVYEEVPTGSGTTFTLAHTPIAGTLRLYRGGARQESGSDYTLAGNTITLANALSSGEVLLADYDY